MFFRFISLIILSFSLITLAACQGDFKLGVNELVDFSENESVISQQVNFKYADWTSFNNATAMIKEFKELNEAQQEIKISVIKLDKNAYVFDILENTMAPKSIAYWQNEHDDLDLLVNGSFFDENNQTTGGIIVNGQGKIYSESGQNVYEGAVIISEEGEMELRYLPEYSLTEKDKENDVLVNFPYLIKKGENYFGTVDKKKAARTMIASDDKSIYFIVCPYAYFTFNEAMFWVKENLPQVQELLNLDGGSSTGISVKINGEVYLINSLGAIPNVISAKQK